MTATTTVPLTIRPEAAARVAELGRQTELEHILEHVRQSVPGLTRLDVELAVYDDEDTLPGVTIVATTNRSWNPADKYEDALSRWKVTTFPPEVCVIFSVALRYDTNHAG
jgi:hypothetical protein